MIIEMATSFMLATGCLRSRGSSDSALYVIDQAEKGRRHLQNSFTGGKEAFEELCDVVEQCREPNWDGYSALPVRDETYRAAYRFLESLPLGTPVPTIGAEPDGHITFEWYTSPKRLLSVSVSPEGELHYAALTGFGKTYGTELFLGEPPRILLSLIPVVTKNA